MQYKKLWIALGVVMLVSFAVLGVVGYKAINNGPPIPGKVVTADGRCCLPARPSATGKMSGSPPVARRSAPSGVTALTLLPTGAPTTCIGNR